MNKITIEIYLVDFSSKTVSRCSIKKMLTESSENSQDKTCYGVVF